MQRDHDDPTAIPEEPALHRLMGRLLARMRVALCYSLLLGVLFASAAMPRAEGLAVSQTPPIQYSEADRHCAIQAAYFEAGTDPASATAVVHTIVNRARDARWPSTLCGVVSQRASRRLGDCQFTFMCDGRPERMTYPPILRQSVAAVDEVLYGGGTDPTRGATCYVRDDAAPAWSRGLEKIQIGRHLFMRC